MTTLTHAELVAAVEKARCPDDCTNGLHFDRTAHLDTLAAILNLHTMGEYQSGETFCDVCVSDISGIVWWPCPTVGIVVDALRKMGCDV